MNWPKRHPDLTYVIAIAISFVVALLSGHNPTLFNWKILLIFAVIYGGAFWVIKQKKRDLRFFWVALMFWPFVFMLKDFSPGSADMRNAAVKPGKGKV